ncbi:MAG: formyltransferase family protein, partial [Prochlorococcus sp.]
MKVLFWGTPAYAVSTLNALINAGQDLVGVVTQPDRRRARGKQLIPSPVKQRALELGLPVFTPVNLRKEHDMQSCLSELQADISVVVAFGQILPSEVLSQ